MVTWNSFFIILLAIIILAMLGAEESARDRLDILEHHMNHDAKFHHNDNEINALPEECK